MESGMIRLYSPDYLEKRRKQNLLRKRILWILALGGAAACIGLCFGVTTANAVRREILVMSLSVGIGWICIYLYRFGYVAAKREIDHGENLNAEEWEPVTGEVEISKQAYRIRNSINIRKVRIETAEGTVSANINASRSREVERAGKRLTLWLSHGYVAAYEVDHEIL